MATLNSDLVVLEPHRRPAPWSGDVSALAEALKNNVSGEVRFDAGSRALYATDGSNYRQVPIGVVIPRSIEDVVATVATCRSFGAPLLSRGGGTSLAGQSCNVAVVMDWSKYVNQIDPLGSCPRRLWTVWRIQMPRPPSGRQALM